MELDELIMIGACSMLATGRASAPADTEIELAVKTARRVWKEVIESDQRGDE